LEKRERDAAAPGFVDEQPFLSGLVLVVRRGTRQVVAREGIRDERQALVGAAE
jgi:hypothetical protein